MISYNKWHDDPIMLRWLARKDLIPPSQEELEKHYIAQEEFERKGLEWDRKENKMIEEYKRKQKEAIDKEKKETLSVGEGENYQPGVWDKKQLIHVKEESSDVQVIEQDISGKYIVDINEMDEQLMNIKEQKMLAPLKELLDLVNIEDYTLEKMNEKYRKDLVKKLTIKCLINDL